MKVMFAADLHGSVRFTEELLSAFNELGCDYLWLLGDILYGAGWPPPQEYDSRETARMLNRHARRIMAVSGNCDCDADLNALAFPGYQTVKQLTTRCICAPFRCLLPDRVFHFRT